MQDNLYTAVLDWLKFQQGEREENREKRIAEETKALVDKVVENQRINLEAIKRGIEEICGK